MTEGERAGEGEREGDGAAKVGGRRGNERGVREIGRRQRVSRERGGWRNGEK